MGESEENPSPRKEKEPKSSILDLQSGGSSSTAQMTNKLEMFHRRCARSITGQHIRPNTDGTWHYPNTQEEFQKAGLEPILHYISRRQSSVKKHLNPTSEAILEIKKAIALDFNLERAIWWKPENPTQDPTLA
jgi:hypothetical protein